MFIPEATGRRQCWRADLGNECERWPEGGPLPTGQKQASRLSGEGPEEGSLEPVPLLSCACGTSQGAAESARSLTRP